MRSSGPNDAARLPPLRLNTGDGDPPDVGPPATDSDVRGWQRWLGFGAALAVGIVAGVVGADARNDTIQRGHVDLIGGHSTLVRPASSGSTPGPWQAEFQVFNSGQEDVEIIDIDVEAWIRPPGTGQGGPTVAEPDRWSAIRTQLVPDCDVEPSQASSGSTLVADLSVRTRSSGTTTIPITFPPGQSWLRATWSSVCAPSDAPNADITIASTEMLDQPPGVHSVRARLHLATATGQGQGTVIRIWSHVPGFDFVYSGLPAKVIGDETSPLELEWEVASCAVAERLDEAQLGFHVAADADSMAARVQSTPVPAAVLVALGRLSAQVCGL